jgi:hypothetical protein
MSDTTPEQQQVAIIRSMGGLVFDAVFEETHQADLEVTDNPVETGVVVSDHAYMKPLSVTLCCGVSDIVLNQINTTDAFASDASRSKKAFELLTELQKKAKPFDLQTGLKLYKNMICTSIRTSQDKDTSNALVFEATLREVLIVYTQAVKYPPRKAGGTKRQAGAKKDKGEQQGKEVSDQKKKASLLSKIGKAVKGG